MNIVQTGSTGGTNEWESLCDWVEKLNMPDTREKALLELCKRRENVPHFAPFLWHSPGAIASLLQEICAVYPYINPPRLTAHQSNRVCNALALLQCLASHPATRSDFLKAHIPFYLYNFLTTNNHTRPFEYLRLTSLGVIGALAKSDESEAINFLLNSEIIPICLVIMESGSELSKTVATFIMQKLLQDDVGLAYICQTYQRFAHVATVLEKMVNSLAEEKSLRLLKHVIRCYQRLGDDSRARDALRSCLPEKLTDGTFADLLENEVATKRSLGQFVRHLSLPIGAANTGTGSAPSTASVSTGGSGTVASLLVGANGGAGERSNSATTGSTGVCLTTTVNTTACGVGPNTSTSQSTASNTLTSTTLSAGCTVAAATMANNNITGGTSGPNSVKSNVGSGGGTRKSPDAST